MMTREDIRGWLTDYPLKPENPTHMIVAIDTFDYEDYPVYVEEGEDAQEKVDEINDRSMQKVMEVYNYSIDLEEQIAAKRVWNI